jgi:cation diffusion facilitator CzcD-associated flavoprotein CzcO
MTDPLDQRPQSAEVANQLGEAAGQAHSNELGPMDRRGFFRGAAALTVGGLGATVGFAQSTTQPGSAAAPTRAADAASTAAPASTDAAAALETQTTNSFRWIGNAPANWVRARAGADHNVVIVGGGQSGLSIAYQLKRKGVGGVDVIDQAPQGRTGMWRNIARMPQLRTPKALAGPELGNPALSFRAWYETRNGAAAFDALDRIPTLAWADYIDWFQQATGTMVRYRTRLLEIEAQGDLLRLHLDAEGTRRVGTTRKLVLANGYAGAGGPNVPDFLRALPTNVWTHTTGAIPFDTMRGKVVGVVGAGSSAFDAAAVALENGAEVHMFSRRSYIDYPVPATPGAPPVDRGYPNVLEQAYDLPDVVRWRNFLLSDGRVASVPLDSVQRAAAFKGFHLHLESTLSDVELAGNSKVAGRVGSQRFRFDHVIAGTGYRIDLSAQPELARIHEHIALWRDRYQPSAGEENAAGGNHPYVGAAFEFQPRSDTGAEFVRNIHCFNLAAALSFGIPVGDVPSVVDQPRLVAAIVRDLYREGIDVEAHKRFIDTPLVAPDAAPYRRAIETEAREVA